MHKWLAQIHYIELACRFNMFYNFFNLTRIWQTQKRRNKSLVYFAKWSLDITLYPISNHVNIFYRGQHWVWKYTLLGDGHLVVEIRIRILPYLYLQHFHLSIIPLWLSNPSFIDMNKIENGIKNKYYTLAMPRALNLKIVDLCHARLNQCFVGLRLATWPRHKR